MKFGGSILKDAQDIRKVATIVRFTDGEKVVVVSALQGVTDEIQKTINELAAGKGNPAAAVSALRARHDSVLTELVRDRELAGELRERLEALLERWERVAFGVQYTEEMTPRTRDFLLSFGERFSVILVEAGLRAADVPAQALEMDKLGCLTDSEFGRATVNLAETSARLPWALKPVLSAGKVPVLTGFFGADESGRTTILGRGGSDYSAAVVAHALGADGLELWKDVEGFYSSDPKLVDGARHIERLSYAEAAELAYFGAKILHPMTIWPLSEKRIPMWLGNVRYSDRSHGTHVNGEAVRGERVIKSVAHSKDMGVLKIHGTGIGHMPGVLATIVGALSREYINIKSVITSQTCIALLLERRDLARAHETVAKAGVAVVERLEPVGDIAIIGIVGEGLNATKGIAGRIFSAVANVNVNVEMISSGASETAYYFIVKEPDLEKAVRAIHDEVFGR